MRLAVKATDWRKCLLKTWVIYSRNSTKFLFKRSRSTLPTTSTSKLEWSYVHGPSSVPLLGQTLGQVLTNNTERLPDKELLVFKEHGIRKTYQEFYKDVNRLAAGLLALDLDRGDRVGIWGPNKYEWVTTQFAAARAGLILVNINPAYRTDELEYCLHKVGVKALVSDETFKTQDYYGMLAEICPELATCAPGDLRSKRLPDLKHVIIYPGNKKFSGAHQYSDILEAGGRHERDKLDENHTKIQFDEAANIQFTSGTTGHPKGAVLSHHNLVNNGYFIGKRLQVNETSRICYPVPLYHCFGCVGSSILSIIHGVTAVSPSPQYDPVKTLQAVQSEKCNILYGTPTMFVDMLHQPNLESYDLSSLDGGIMAGAPCPEELMKDVISRLNMRHVAVAYGTTENSPVTFMGFPNDELDRRCGTIGYPMDHTEVKVVDPVTQEMTAVNTPGELYTRGYFVFLGYWNDPDKTEETMTKDRWYKTGDLAVLDEDGYGKIVGRLKDCVIRGGENIYPREIEEFILQHPAVMDVHICGVPDSRMGEELCAWIKIKAGETLTEKDVKEFCKGKISHFKIPRYILFVGTYPMTISGKVQKFIMRQESISLLNLHDS